MSPSRPQSLEVHWGTVGDEPGPTASAAPPGRIRRVGWVAAAALALLTVVAAGSSLLAEDERRPETVSDAYVDALQRLDCKEIATYTTDGLRGATMCRFLLFRAQHGDGAEIARQVQQSRFSRTDVEESAWEATVRYRITSGGRDVVGTARLERDEDARWRVGSFFIADRRGFERRGTSGTDPRR